MFVGCAYKRYTKTSPQKVIIRSRITLEVGQSHLLIILSLKDLLQSMYSLTCRVMLTLGKKSISHFIMEKWIQYIPDTCPHYYNKNISNNRIFINTAETTIFLGL